MKCHHHNMPDFSPALVSGHLWIFLSFLRNTDKIWSFHQIKTALGISGISSEQSAWSKRADDEEGTQIDMIIKRKDNIVNMCEMKFYSAEFKVDKKYHAVLINRQELLEREIPSRSVIHNVLITTKGLKYNEYSGFFDNVITLDELFA